MVDSLEDLWLSLENRADLHLIVINADNGPENSSHRTHSSSESLNLPKANLLISVWRIIHSITVNTTQ
jgi:hypothetical protein